MSSASVMELKERGNAAFKTGRFVEAVSYFSEAIAMDPNNHILYSNRSAAHASLHRYEEALADGQTAVCLKPDWAKAYGRVATAYFALESWDDAVVAYMQGLELDPYNANMRSGLRDALAHSKGDPTQAPWVPPHVPGPHPIPSAQAFFPTKQTPSHGYNGTYNTPMPAGPVPAPVPVPEVSIPPLGHGPPDPHSSPLGSSLIFAVEPIQLWSSEHVSAFLQQLELPSLIPSFKENGVNGRDLLVLSDNDFVLDLGVTRLQLRKLRAGIAELRTALPHLVAGGPQPVQEAARKPVAPESGSWFDMYVSGNPYVQQFTKKKPFPSGPPGPHDGAPPSWGPPEVPAGPSGSAGGAGPSGVGYDGSSAAGWSAQPQVPDPDDLPAKPVSNGSTAQQSASTYSSSYSFKPSEQFKMRPAMPAAAGAPRGAPFAPPRPTTESPLAEGRDQQRWGPAPSMKGPQQEPYATTGSYSFAYSNNAMAPSEAQMGPQTTEPPGSAPTGTPAMAPGNPESDANGGPGAPPARQDGIYRDGVMFQGAPTSDGYLDERAFMRAAPPPAGYDMYGRPIGGLPKGYYTSGGTHMRMPSMDGMYGERTAPARGAVVFRELPAMVQAPPVVKVHPQLKAEANWVQRLIQNLLAPRVWEGADGVPKEINTQRHIVKLKTAMAQAVAVGFFELTQRGAGQLAWTQSRGFVLSNLGWREGQPVWTAPCFYEIKAGMDRSAMQQGSNDITCCLIINSVEALKKMARGRPVLGIDIPLKTGFSDGPLEGDSDIADPKVADLMVFSVRRGQALDLNLAGGRIIGTEDNFTYFGRGVTPERILSGKVPQPEEFQSAYKSITSLTVGGATLLSFMQSQN